MREEAAFAATACPGRPVDPPADEQGTDACPDGRAEVDLAVSQASDIARCQEDCAEPATAAGERP